MQLSDLSKEVQRFLLEHWTTVEINDRLHDPEYFFEHIVNSRLAFLRRQGQDAPRIQAKRNPKGELVVLLKP